MGIGGISESGFSNNNTLVVGSEQKMIEVADKPALTEKMRHAISEELSIEDRLNEEVREILSQWADEMRRQGASYQEMYKKVKGQLARDRKLILR